MFDHRKASGKPTRPQKIIIFILFAIGFVFVVGSAIQLLWNWILVDAAGMNPISIWQAIGLLVLARILFGGMFWGGRRQWGKSKRAEWKKKWRDMSPEDKEAFKQKWRERCQKPNSEKPNDRGNVEL